MAEYQFADWTTEREKDPEAFRRKLSRNLKKVLVESLSEDMIKHHVDNRIVRDPELAQVYLDEVVPELSSIFPAGSEINVRVKCFAESLRTALSEQEPGA